MSFDHLAMHYRWMEAVLAGDVLQRCRTCWLGEVRDAKRVLLAGEGNGRMLEACALALPGCQITVLDQSEAMLNQARERWRKNRDSQNVTFKRADLRAWTSGQERFDLVVTNFFLDCFAADELHQVVANLSASASSHARWLLADFTVPHAGWKRARALGVLALAYGFFRIATDISANRITEPDTAMRMTGFVLQRQKRFNHGLLRADLWARDG